MFDRVQGLGHTLVQHCPICVQAAHPPRRVSAEEPSPSVAMATFASRAVAETGAWRPRSLQLDQVSSEGRSPGLLDVKEDDYVCDRVEGQREELD